MRKRSRPVRNNLCQKFGSTYSPGLSMCRVYSFAIALVAMSACFIDRCFAGNYAVAVSNEQSGDVSLIAGDSFEVIATIPVGKRPRGIQASKDGKLLYVALSGSPNEGPP